MNMQPLSQFDRLLPYILRHEGVSSTNPTGLADIPNDPGGTTNWGISQAAWASLVSRFPGYPLNVKDLTRDQATAIYKEVYYLPICDNLPPSTAMLIFDCEVNEGMGLIILQRAIGTIDDGKWGPESDQALRLALRSITKLNECIIWHRLLHYTSLARSDTATSQRGFLVKLWIPRLNVCRAEERTL